MNKYGQLGFMNESIYLPENPGLEEVSDVSLGSFHSLFLLGIL